MLIKTRKIRYPEYDYKNVRASAGRNAIHDYPAMLHSKLVESLIAEFSGAGSVIYDPFCGSGTTVVQALSAGYDVYGTDINPLALLIAKVRATDIDAGWVGDALHRLRCDFPSMKPDIPDVKNIRYWFKEDVIEDLGRIRRFISGISDDDLRDFCLVSFSSTVRAVSNNRNNEFKRYRLSKEKLEEYAPDVFGFFAGTAMRYSSFLARHRLRNNRFKLYSADTRFPLPFEEKVDLIVTSPPYGDSRTTVAYGQFSSFSLDWIKGLNPFGDADISLDRTGLGGKPMKERRLEISDALCDTLAEVEKKDSKRACEVNAFFHDLFLSCRNISTVLKSSSTVCFVVGNRSVKEVRIPMDSIVVDFFEALGLRHLETRVREISNKRMPSLNSPTNVVGKKSPTMREEYIVILRGDPK